MRDENFELVITDFGEPTSTEAVPAVPLEYFTLWGKYRAESKHVMLCRQDSCIKAKERLKISKGLDVGY